MCNVLRLVPIAPLFSISICTIWRRLVMVEQTRIQCQLKKCPKGRVSKQHWVEEIANCVDFYSKLMLDDATKSTNDARSLGKWDGYWLWLVQWVLRGETWSVDCLDCLVAASAFRLSYANTAYPSVNLFV